ncbi:MAG: permease [Bacteroidales bacterium]|nr:permease [Bacteroidales bacterium]
MEKLYYVFLHSKTREILIEAWVLFIDLLPYLIIGIFLTVALKLYLSKEKVAGFFTHNKKSSIILSSLLGVVSPLGSYVVMPMSAALLNIGVPFPVILAFLVSSPLINPNLFLLTAGALGYEMAIMRVISAFLIGLFVGYGARFLLKKGYLKQETLQNSNSIRHYPDFFNSEKKRVTFKLFMWELYRMGRYISRYFFIAILLAAFIKIITSPDVIPNLFEGNKTISVILSVFAGIPFYVCGGAAIPFVQALAELGLSQGAILAFFISGPATRLSNLVILHSLYNRRVFIFYILCCLIGAFIFGYVYNIFIFVFH